VECGGGGGGGESVSWGLKLELHCVVFWTETIVLKGWWSKTCEIFKFERIINFSFDVPRSSSSIKVTIGAYM
jgi:hypothetical protein